VAPRPPDFLIVGTMKSGTSTLADHLREHPRVWLPEREVHYFDNDEKFARGAAYYERELWQGYPGNATDSVLLGEKTPTYSYRPEVAERIFALTETVRLIWIFREPVARTFSNYLHRRKQGQELASFRRAVFDEARRLRTDRYCGYVKRSQYAEQVRRFLEFFPKEQMHFLLFEDLVATPEHELLSVTRFLGLSPQHAKLEQKASNQTVVPRVVLPMYVARKVFGRHSGVYWRVRRLCERFPAPKPRIEPDVRRHLERVFEPHNRELAQLTGLDLSAWASG
jgi:hypothetical protein